MKYFLLFSILMSMWLFVPSAQSACDYYDLMLDCKQKNDAGLPAASTDYLCVNSTSDEEILFNIILDKKNAPIDKEAFDFLRWLDTTKNYFFGAAPRASYFQGVDIVGIKFGLGGEYWKQYEKVCDPAVETSVSQEVIACLGGVNEGVQRVNLGNAKDYLSETSCLALAELKLKIYSQIAYDIMKINKASVRRDNRKRFMQSQRQKYETLLNIMRINVGYMERIWKKWPSKTKNAL